MLVLSDELREAVLAHPGEPVQIVDPTTHEKFVLVQSATYGRMKRVVLDDFNPRVGMAMMNEVMAADDAHDPYLASYQLEES